MRLEAVPTFPPPVDPSLLLRLRLRRRCLLRSEEEIRRDPVNPWRCFFVPLTADERAAFSSYEERYDSRCLRHGPRDGLPERWDCYFISPATSSASQQHQEQKRSAGEAKREREEELNEAPQPSRELL